MPGGVPGGMLKLRFDWYIRTQDPNIKTGAIRNPRQSSQLIHDPLCFQNPRFTAKIHNPYYFKANSVDLITYSPPPGVVKPTEAISEVLFFRPLYSPKQS